MQRRSQVWRGAALVLAALFVTATQNTRAALAADEASSWWDGVKFSGYVEGGYTFNDDALPHHLNFGRLFDDEADRILLNQLSLTLERPIDSKKDYDLGFKLQGFYGSDARYTHFLGEWELENDSRHQVDLLEAYLNFHTPWIGEGGTDIKVGHYVTLEGAEVIDPRGNYLYSHSYIFNFGIPLKHTGVLAVTHVNSNFDVYYGIDSGVNTSLGAGDNNDAAAFHGGFGFTLFDGKLTGLFTTHIGPETPDDNTSLRYLSDGVITWKITDKLTSITELNYIRDDAGHADGYGVASYYIYAFTDRLSVVLRDEIWRDNDGFFVGAFPGNLDFVKIEKGDPTGRVIGFGPTTYSAVTLGLNIKPEVPKRFEGFVIRPEIRFDHSSQTRPFDGDDDQFTAGVDVIVPFGISP